MHIDFYFISAVANLIANLVALIVAALYCYRSFNPPYMRIFLLYLFGSMLVEVLANSYVGNLFGFQIYGNSQYAQNVIYNLFTLFELFMFSWFLFGIIRSSLIKRILIALVIIFTISFICYCVWVDLGKYLNTLAVVVESIIIVIPCLTYFRELFTRNRPIDLLREPSFWMVTGIIFYLATITPVNFAGAYLSHRGYSQVALNLYSINNFAFVITNLLFIKGFTCRRKKS